MLLHGICGNFLVYSLLKFAVTCWMKDVVLGDRNFTLMEGHVAVKEEASSGT
jgi:hypothetical protein